MRWTERRGFYIKWIRIYVVCALLLLFACTLAVCLIGFSAKWLGPPPLAVPQTTLYYATNGELIDESSNGQTRYWVDLDSMSPLLIKATIAIEDKSFYKHNGFDFKRIAAAVLADVKAMKKVQGASTISQQYARNLFLGTEKTWKRKAKEAYYTVRIEQNYSKSDILEGYLNTIYYGHGMYGVQSASNYYFHKDASALSLAEAAMLAGIPKGPGLYSPLVSMKNATNRQQLILAQLEANRIITKQEMQEAIAEPLHIYGGANTIETARLAPYFLDVVHAELETILADNPDAIKLGGLKVYTTLDVEQQQLAEKVVSEKLPTNTDLQVALVAMDSSTGKVSALIGGRAYAKSPFNRATMAVRQPGSTIKPLLYYAALEKGFTPSTTMRSEITTFSYDDGNSNYTPHNFNNQYANEEITLAQALALSDNVYAVKTHLFLGEHTLIDAMKRFGLTSKATNVPSLALGTSGVRPLEMVNAYNLFANGGEKVRSVFITKIENHQGTVLYEWEKDQQRVLEPDKAFVMTEMLTGIFDSKLNGYASVTGSTILPKLSRPYAGKSGSTETDSWMIGFSPQLTAGVWTGYDQSKKMETQAEFRAAKEVWSSFMEGALANTSRQEFHPPKGVIAVNIDPVTGLLASEHCPVKRQTYFTKGTEPVEYCGLHRESSDKEPEHKHDDSRKQQPWYKKFKGLFKM